MPRIQDIPDRELYTPWFSPWLAKRGSFHDDYEHMKEFTLVSKDRCYVLYKLGRQALGLLGDFCECGVYRGGTAMLLNQLLARFDPRGPRMLHIFDTFTGSPEPTPGKDIHERGDFGDASEVKVRGRLPFATRVSVHPGLIPASFACSGLDKIVFAHVDVDLYQSVLDCCRYIYQRLVVGGFIVFDDYGFPECPGARQAVDSFFANKPEFPLTLGTGQAIVCKL
jgi:O-methyltransferase